MNNELMNRIERLEINARRSQFAAVILLCLLCGSVFIGFDRGPSDVLRTRKLEILDGKGGVAIALEDLDTSGPTISLGKLGDTWAAQFAVSVNDEGMLLLRNGDGKLGISARAFDFGGSVTVHGKGKAVLWESPM